MTQARVPDRLMAFLQTAVPQLEVLEPGDEPSSYPGGTLLLSTASSPDNDAGPGGNSVVASVRVGAGGSRGRLSISVAGGGLSEEARAALDEIAGANRDDAPTQPLDPGSGAVLYCLARARRTRRALEIGTGAGASTVWLASAAAGTGGRVTSVERDSAMRVLARKNLRRAGLLDRVDLRLGESERVLPALSGKFDLVLLDEDPADRTDDLEMLLGACARGALVVSPGSRRDATRLSVYNATVRSHPAVGTSVDIATAAGVTLSLLR